MKQKILIPVLVSIILAFSIPLSVKSQCTLLITNPPTVCSPGTVDITTTSITEGSSAGLSFTYWTDTAATNALDNPDAVAIGGTYYIKADDGVDCEKILPVLVTIRVTPVLVINDPEPVCFPTPVDITIPEIVEGSDPGLTYTYWLNASGTNPLTFASSIRFSGTFYIRAEAEGGCFTFLPVNVIISPNPTLITNDPLPTCLGDTIDLTDPSITAGSTAGLTFSYWESFADTVALNNPADVTISGFYGILAMNAYGCLNYDSVKVEFVEPYSELGIAITTVDPVTGKNALVWDPPVNKGVEYVNIYKQDNISQEYDLLETIDNTSEGQYIDLESHPEMKADSYKISAIDTCGNESELASAQKTMYLMGNVIEQGSVNLLWSAYGGADIAFYLIHRKSDGGDYEVAGTVIGGTVLFNDSQPPALPLTYKVEAIPRNSEASMDLTSFSNEVRIVSSSIDLNSLNQIIKVYPLPFSDLLNIEVPIEQSGGFIEMHNLLGELIHQWKITNSQVKLNTSDIPGGTYILSIQGDESFRRLVVK